MVKVEKTFYENDRQDATV